MSDASIQLEKESIVDDFLAVTVKKQMQSLFFNNCDDEMMLFPSLEGNEAHNENLENHLAESHALKSETKE